jgi:hypothetical protein
MNTGGVFGQYKLCNRYNGHADFQKFVQNQVPFYNHRPPARQQSGTPGLSFPQSSEFHGYYHRETPHLTSGLQFIADVTDNEYRHWDNGTIVQQPYFKRTNNAGVVPIPVVIGHRRPSVPTAPRVYDQAVQTMHKGHVLYQENGPGRYQHSFDSRPEWLKRRDSCVFCRMYDGKEPNEILYKVC